MRDNLLLFSQKRKSGHQRVNSVWSINLADRLFDVLHRSVTLRNLQWLRSRCLRKNFYLRQNTALLHRGTIATWIGWSYRFRCLQRQSEHDFRDDELVSRGGARGLCEAVASKIWDGFSWQQGHFHSQGSYRFEWRYLHVLSVDGEDNGHVGRRCL